jgi:hypothetical protein
VVNTGVGMRRVLPFHTGGLDALLEKPMYSTNTDAKVNAVNVLSGPGGLITASSVWFSYTTKKGRALVDREFGRGLRRDWFGGTASGYTGGDVTTRKAWAVSSLS